MISTHEKGTLVYYDRRSSQAKLILESAPGKVIECDANKVKALAELPVDYAQFPLTQKLLSSLIMFAAASDKKEEEKKIDRERRVQQYFLYVKHD